MRFIICILSLSILSACSHREALVSTELETEVGESYHDIRLLKIVEQQQRVIEQIEEEYASGQYDEATLRYKMQEVTRQYQSFLSDNPRSIEGLICYGKLLRRCGEREEAHFTFMRANVMAPELAVIKQQMGNFYAEELKYDLALAMYMEACRLEPNEATYYYGLGELLQVFREEFIKTESITEKELEKEMLLAFGKASELSHDTIDFKFRYAEAFYDLSEPDWNQAIETWKSLLLEVESEVQIQSIYLHLARIYSELQAFEDAKSYLCQVDLPILDYSKKEVQQMISEQYPSELEL